MMQPAELLPVCEKAARAGAAVLLEWQGKINASEKGPRDLVTEADVASQNVIREIVLAAFPEHRFLGEEDSPEVIAAETSDSEYRWLVDPLDGTTNYVHQLPGFAVSIGVEHKGELVAGVVYDPRLDECFAAAKGNGATLNGEPIKTSECTQINHALVATGFSIDVAQGSIEIERFIEMLPECQALRRLGSAALNLCYLANGRMDGYWAVSVKIWDIAAGVVILREAGGVITDIEHKPFNPKQPRFVAAANTVLQNEMFRVLDRAKVR